MKRTIERELKESSLAIGTMDGGQIEAIANALIKVFRARGKAVFFGNGGSASDAQHLAAELSGRYMMERPALDGVSLSSLSAMTAIGNDYSYDITFVRQIEACVHEGDAVIGISTSGNSKNCSAGHREGQGDGGHHDRFLWPDREASGDRRYSSQCTIEEHSTHTRRVHGGRPHHL